MASWHYANIFIHAVDVGKSLNRLFHVRKISVWVHIWVSRFRKLVVNEWKSLLLNKQLPKTDCKNFLFWPAHASDHATKCPFLMPLTSKNVIRVVIRQHTSSEPRDARLLEMPSTWLLTLPNAREPQHVFSTTQVDTCWCQSVVSPCSGSWSSHLKKVA